MAIDWSRVITVEDEETTQIICGKEILYLRGERGYPGRGITSIEKTSTSGLIDTYTITYTDGTTSTFQVRNGSSGSRSIASIEKTSSTGSVDTYTITYTDGTTSTFQVRNADMTDVIAYEFDPEESYSSSDYVLYNNELYRFNTDHAVSPWNPYEVTKITVMDQVSQLMNWMPIKATVLSLAPYFDERNEYSVGDYVTYEGYLYKFTSSHLGIWDFDDVETVAIMDEFNEIKDSLKFDVIAVDFDKNRNGYFTRGDYVWKLNYGKYMLYRFLVDHHGPWSYDDVTTVGTVMEEIQRLDDVLTAKIGIEYYDESKSYSIGDLVQYEDDFYKFTWDHPAGEWDGLGVRKVTIVSLINDNLSSDVVAYNFNPYNSYSIGDYVMYNGKLYTFIADHPAGAWDEDDVSIVHLANDFIDNRKFEYRISNKANSISLAPEFSESNTYAVGDYVMRNGILYKTSTAHTGAWNNNDFYAVEVTDEFLDQSDLNLYLADKANLSVIAPDFNAIFSYIPGERVIYNGKLYQFTNSHSGEWNQSDVFEVKLINLINNNEFNIKNRAHSTSIAPLFSESDTYAVGDYVMYNDILYKTSTAHTGAWNNNDFYAVEVTDEFLDQSDLNLYLADKANLSIIAPDFNSIFSYVPGERVIYNEKLYQFVNAHSGEWSQSDVSEVKIINLINNNESNIKQKAPYWTVANAFNTYYHYSPGDYVIYGDYLYKFTDNHQGEWDNSHATRIALADDVLTLNRTIKWKAPLSAIAGNFIENTVYLVGDYVIYDGVLYRFTATHTGAWDSTHVTQVALADEIRSVDLNKTSLSNVADEFSTSEAYTAGDCVIRNGNLYRFTTDHTAGAWNANQVEQVNLITVIDENGKAIWGEISGNITDQTDLMELLEVAVEKTVYVSASTGSDTNDGTQEHPFATLAKAVEAIPESGKGTIYIGTGTYDEDLSITGKTVEIQKYNVASQYSITINGMSILNSDVTFDGVVAIDLLQQATVENSTFTAGSNVSFKSGTSETAIAERFVINNSKVVINGSITAYGSNARPVMIYAFPNDHVYGYGYAVIRAYNSYVYVKALTTNAYFPVLIQDGSIFCYKNFTNVDTLRNITNDWLTGTGGRIYTGVGIDFGTMASKNDTDSAILSGRKNGSWFPIGSEHYNKSEINDLLDEKQDILGVSKTGKIIKCNDCGNSILGQCDVEINASRLNPKNYTLGSTKNLLPTFTDIQKSQMKLVVDPYGACWIKCNKNNVTNEFNAFASVTLNAGTYTLSAHNPEVSQPTPEGHENSMVFGLSTYNQVVPFESQYFVAILEMLSVNDSVTFTLSATTTLYCHMRVYNMTSWGVSSTNGWADNFVFYPMIEAGNTATDYEPYHFTSPISGWTGCSISHYGKNLFDKTDVTNEMYDITMANGIIKESTESVLSDYIEVDGNFTFSFSNSASVSNGNTYFHLGLYDENKTFIELQEKTSYADETYTKLTINNPAVKFVRCNISNTIDIDTVQLEIGSEMTDYQPYQKTVHQISWQTEAGTIYGGKLDVLSGTLTVTHGYIASYNGETLSGEWISDRNNYNPNGTPSTGAQVVYELATPQSYQISPEKIKTVFENDTFIADAGNVSVRYIKNDPIVDVLNQKQDLLTFDTTPTASSTNPVTSGGIKTALDEKQDTLTFDTTPTANSTNPVTSGGVKTALDDKADVITTSASGDPVTITDGSPAPVVDLTVAIEPVQDLHGLLNPYPAGGGKNLMPPIVAGTYTGGGITVVVDSNNLITVSGTKNTDSFVKIELPYGVSGISYQIDSWIHVRNSVVNSNVRLYFATTTEGYVTFSVVNRKFQFTTGRTMQTAALGFLADIPSGTELNFTLQPSIELESTDADYEPYENICPISGWTGAKIYHTKDNLLTITATSTIINGVEYTVNPDGSIIANGTATSSAFLDVGNINLKANTTYWLAGCPNDGGNNKYRLYYRNVNPAGTMDNGNGSSYTPTENETRTVRLVVYSGFTAQNLVFRPTICLASDSHSIYHISWQSEAGTVYGGSMDVTTGVLTVTHVKVDMESNFTFSKSSGAWTTNTFYIGTGQMNLITPTDSILKCSHFKTNMEQIDDGNGIYHIASGTLFISCDASVCGDTVGSFRQWLVDQKTAGTPVELWYELITPVTYQLTPTEVTTLLGENTISADTGAVDVTYRADTKTYIDQKIAESQRATRSLIAGIETEMIATKNYSIGDLLIVGDTLYKVTANIANGSAITVGTNVTATTVAEQLILLANA